MTPYLMLIAMIYIGFLILMPTGIFSMVRASSKAHRKFSAPR